MREIGNGTLAFHLEPYWNFHPSGIISQGTASKSFRSLLSPPPTSHRRSTSGGRKKKKNPFGGDFMTVVFFASYIHRTAARVNRYRRRHNQRRVCICVCVCLVGCTEFSCAAAVVAPPHCRITSCVMCRVSANGYTVYNVPVG